MFQPRAECMVIARLALSAEWPAWSKKQASAARLVCAECDYDLREFKDETRMPFDVRLPERPMMIPGLLQTPAYAQAVIEETLPEISAEQAAARLKVRMRRQHRIYDPGRPLRLWVVLDESVLHRVVGSPEIMREQLEHLKALSTELHISVQVLPYTAGAHPGLPGQFSILGFADSAQTGVVHLERFTSDLYLEKPSDVQHYSAIQDHLQARALAPADSRDFITDATKALIDTAGSPVSADRRNRPRPVSSC
ncbi:DUF5753 domain-containing protein [Streptomyces sp. LN704]|uniref:DUF5753 domain-containing protein n=1 Tax=Streptomyces sp. LN704 TaxID=3112982 RepID=UPI003714ACDF